MEGYLPEEMALIADILKKKCINYYDLGESLKLQILKTESYLWKITSKESSKNKKWSCKY